MPLNINFSPLGPKTRKRFEDPYQTEAEIYGQTDPTLGLGRLARSGAETSLVSQIPKLNFDPLTIYGKQAEEIDRQAQIEKEKLGRQFALTPGGTTTPGLQGGEQQRGFEELSSNIVGLKSQAYIDLQKQAQQENRANVAALQSIQKGVEQGALSAGQLNLAAVSQGLQVQGQEFEQGIRRAQTFGKSGPITSGTETEETRRNKAIEALQKSGQEITEKSVDAEIAAQDRRLQQAEDALYGGSLGKAFPIRDLDNARNTKRGDPNYRVEFDVNQDGVIDNADVQTVLDMTRDIGNGIRQLPGRTTLAAGAQAADVGFRAGAAVGQVPLVRPDGTPDIDPATGKQRMGTSLDAQRLGLQTAETFGEGWVYNPNTKVYDKTDTLSGKVLSLDKGKLAFATYQATGKIPLYGKGNEILTDGKGNIIYNDTIDLQRLQADKDTMSRQLGVSEAGIRGKIPVYDKAGNVVKDDKGNIVYDDTFEASQAKFDNALKQAGVTGQITVKDAQGRGVVIPTQQALNDAVDRAVKQGETTGVYVDPVTGVSYETLTSQAQYGGAKPVVFTSNDLTASAGKKKGDAGYREEFDVNRDGTIGYDDVQSLTQGSENLGDGRFQYRPGPRTLAGAGQDIETRFKQAEMSGKIGMRDDEGKPMLDAKGNVITIDTVQNRISTGDLALRQAGVYGEGEVFDPTTGKTLTMDDGKGGKIAVTKTTLDQQGLYGGVTLPNGLFKSTLPRDQWTGQQKLAYQDLAIKSRTQSDAAKATWAEITGVAAGKPGTMGTSEFIKNVKDSTEGRPFDPAADFNGDGLVNIDDLLLGGETGQLVTDDQAPVPTLAARTLNASIEQAANILNVNKDQFTKNMALSKDQLNQQVSQFKSNFSGILVDDKGQAAWTWKAVGPQEQAKLVQDFQAQIGDLKKQAATAFSQGDFTAKARYEKAAKDLESQITSIRTNGGMWQQPTALDQQQFTENVRQYNKNMDIIIDQFEKRLGLDKAELTAEQWAAVLDAFTRGIVGIYTAQAGKGTPGKAPPTVGGGGIGGQYGPPTSQGGGGGGLGSIWDWLKSDRDTKEDIQPLTHEDVLRKVAKLPISTWRYKGDKTRHIGPMAQDFKKAFRMGDSDRRIHVVDAIGINLSAVKALTKKVDKLEKKAKVS